MFTTNINIHRSAFTNAFVKRMTIIILIVVVYQMISFAAIPINGGNESDIQAVLDNMPLVGGDRTIHLNGTFNKLNRQVYIEKNNVKIIGINDPQLINIVFLIDAHNVTLDDLTLRGSGQGLCIVIGNLPPGSNFPFTEASLTNLCHSNIIQNCRFKDLYSQQGEGGAIIRIEPFHNHYGNKILNNSFTGWGNGSALTHVVKVGGERLNTDGSYSNHPVFSDITVIKGNYIEGNLSSPPGTYSSTIQVYNPSHVLCNEIRNAFVGVSTKGSDNLVKGNRIYGMYGDGGLYMRDGNNNIFEDNLVEGGFAGFYAWSGKQAIFKNNVFANNTRCGTINSAKHNGYRVAGWDMAQDPLAPQGLAFYGQTSHQFTNDQSLFVNNTFYKNSYGVQWDIWTPQTSFGKPDTTYFVNNIFWGDDGNTFRDHLFLKWNPGNPSDQGGIPNDPVPNSVYLYNNIFHNGFNGSVPSVYVAGAANDATVTWTPCMQSFPYAPINDAQLYGLANSSSIPGFSSAFGLMTFETRRGALLEDCDTTILVEEDCQLLENRGFDTNMDNWNSWACDPIAANGAANITNIIPGPEVWVAGFYQEGIPILQGEEYTVSFRAKADANRSMDVKLGLGVPPYTSYAYQVYNLTPVMQNFTFTFTMTNPSDLNTKFDFLVGIVATPVQIDDVSITTGNCPPSLELKAFLEGCYNPGTERMNTDLNTIHRVLPGQANSDVSAGQPYNTAPWNYGGTEGLLFDDNSYTNTIVDWVLVSLRTEVARTTEVGRFAALLETDGQVRFVEPVNLSLMEGDSVYIVLEHRNHLGVMSADKVVMTATGLVYDFSTQNTYANPGLGSKEVVPGVWTLYGGDAAQLSDIFSYDINGDDSAFWKFMNGNFSTYSAADLNLDGDVNAVDRILWARNNGVNSGVPR